MTLVLPSQEIASNLIEAITKGDTFGYYLKKYTPSYNEIRSALKVVESQNGSTWKELLTDACAIFEFPTLELLQFIGFLTDLLDIDELIELEAAHGMFSFLLKDHCPRTVQINAIDSAPKNYISTYRPVSERTIPDQLQRFVSAKSRNQLANVMAIQVWPSVDDEPSLRSLIQKEVLSALVLIGEPSGGSCVSVNFDEFAKNKNYIKHRLPVKQVCFLDTELHAIATTSDQGRSMVTLYLHNKSGQGYSEKGFINAVGEECFMKQYPPTLSDKLVVQDYIIDKRIPAWISNLKGDELTRAIEITSNVMRTPSIFDGYIPSELLNMDNLEYWYTQRSQLQNPPIPDSRIIEWQNIITQLPIKGIANYQFTYGMPAYIRTITVAQKWLWVYFSQRNPPPGWDINELALVVRFDQLWNSVQDERRICNVAEFQNSSIRQH
jgi:hypothetical protein